jgi:hypothetical protein
MGGVSVDIKKLRLKCNSVSNLSDFGFQICFYRSPSPSEKEQEETIIRKDKSLQLRFRMP